MKKGIYSRIVKRNRIPHVIGYQEIDYNRQYRLTKHRHTSKKLNTRKHAALLITVHCILCTDCRLTKPTKSNVPLTAN